MSSSDSAFWLHLSNSHYRTALQNVIKTDFEVQGSLCRKYIYILLLDSSHILIKPSAFTEYCSVTQGTRVHKVTTKLTRPLSAEHTIDIPPFRELIFK